MVSRQSLSDTPSLTQKIQKIRIHWVLSGAGPSRSLLSGGVRSLSVCPSPSLIDQCVLSPRVCLPLSLFYSISVVVLQYISRLCRSVPDVVGLRCFGGPGPLTDVICVCVLFDFRHRHQNRLTDLQKKIRNQYNLQSLPYFLA